LTEQVEEGAERAASKLGDVEKRLRQQTQDESTASKLARKKLREDLETWTSEQLDQFHSKLLGESNDEAMKLVGKA
jgi:hypothetical protein